MIGSIAVTSPLAGRCTHDAVAIVRVDVRLAVGDDDHLRTAQLAIEDLAQRLRRPRQPLVVAELMLGLEIADERAEILGERVILRRRQARRGRSSPSPRSSARMPCTQPRQLSCATITVITETTAPSPTKK